MLKNVTKRNLGNRSKSLHRLKRKRRRASRRFWEKFCVDTYQRLLTYSCMLTHADVSEASDLVQGTILRVLKYAPYSDGVRNQFRYLCRVALNIRITQTKQRRNEESLDDLPQKDLDNPALIVATDISKVLEDLERFKRQHGPLNQELAITIRMRLEGYTWAEIAAFLKEPVHRTKFRWYDFRNRIRGGLRRMDR